MKILYVTTVSDTMGFFTSHIKMLLDEGHTVDMACNIIKPITQELLDLGCNCYNIDFHRSPIKARNLKAYKKLKNLIIEKGYDIIHTHTPVASVYTRFACKRMKNVKIIYTAHGFHFYNGAPLVNWLLYYPIEKLLSRYTDVLVTINNEDYKRANKLFKTKRVEYVPGVGLNTKKFDDIVVNRKDKLREFGVPKDAFVLLSVGELNKNKNHETAIKAVAKLNNPNIYYLICGQGPLKNYLQKLIEEFGLEKQVKMLGFRQDIAEIYKVSDVLVFPSFREGLSVALMEAMACGLPIVCSNIRGNMDLIENNKGGFLVEPYDITGFAKSIENILVNNKLNEGFRLYNIKKIKLFDQKEVLNKIKEIY